MNMAISVYLILQLDLFLRIPEVNASTFPGWACFHRSISRRIKNKYVPPVTIPRTLGFSFDFNVGCEISDDIEVNIVRLGELDFFVVEGVKFHRYNDRIFWLYGGQATV